MNILLIGSAGFIGTNLALKLAQDQNNRITLADKSKAYFSAVNWADYDNVSIVESDFGCDMDFGALLDGTDVVYHLVSTTAPLTSNRQIPEELMSNVVFTANLLEGCVRSGVKKVVFLSSGGTVYGRRSDCPLPEDTPAYPISSYGLQKVTIEKLLYLYNYMHGLDYRIIRLANPYGPYQRPQAGLGAITIFIYKGLMNEEIEVYGDGSVVRDFIYIDDAVRGILNIVNGENEHRLFNLGSGHGTSIRQALTTVGEALGVELKVHFLPGRTTDVPKNYIDISRYESAYGKLHPLPLLEGVKKTAEFMRGFYSIP